MQLQNVPKAYLEHNASAAEVLGIVVAIVGVAAVYMLPSIIGWRRREAGAIIRLNFLLGWTVVGWVVAMFWATKADDDCAKR